MSVETIAWIAAGLFGALALFQVSLALGAPMGEYVYGGRVADEGGRLPGKWRIASAAAAVILLGFGWVILARAGVIATTIDETVLTVLSRMVVAYMAINAAANLAGKTSIERYLFGGVTLVLVILCSIVAAAGPT